MKTKTKLIVQNVNEHIYKVISLQRRHVEEAVEDYVRKHYPKSKGWSIRSDCSLITAVIYKSLGIPPEE